eukprot:5276503-Prymnesium_polylepis.1
MLHACESALRHTHRPRATSRRPATAVSVARPRRLPRPRATSRRPVTPTRTRAVCSRGPTSTSR